MGGWATKRGEHGTMAERIARTRATRRPGVDPAASRDQALLGPVLDADGPAAGTRPSSSTGRQAPTGVWMVRACRQLLAADGWIVADEWLPGDRLRPGKDLPHFPLPA